MIRFQSTLRRWLPIAVVLVGVSGLVYLAIQQSWRRGANDPQIQVAHDAARAIAGGEPLESVLPTRKVDLGQSLAPFVIVYSEDGSVAGSSAELHGHTPRFPAGILKHAREHGENRVTLEPEPGVRVAAVVTPYAGPDPGFVLVGRSLREVEARVFQWRVLVGVTLVALLLASFAAVALGEAALKEREDSDPKTGIL